MNGYNDNKAIASALFGIFLYLWTASISLALPVHDSSNLLIIYAITWFVALTMFFFIDISPRMFKSLVYIFLITYLYPIIYVFFTEPGLTYFAAVVTAYFSILGIIPGLLLMYSGKRERMITRLGILLIVFNIAVNLIIEIVAGISIQDFVMLNSLYITSALPLSMETLQYTAGNANITSAPKLRRVSGGIQHNIQYKSNIATIIFRLPSNCQPPTVYVNGKAYIPSIHSVLGYVLELTANSMITVNDTVCRGITYTPVVNTIQAEVGKVKIVSFIPMSNMLHTPSKVLMKTNLNDWDPKVWVNRTLSIYNIKKVIGEGGNGYVLKGEVEGKDVAIKVFKLYGGKPEEYFNELTSEASSLINLSNHDNIVKIYAINVDSFVIKEILNDKTDLYLTNPPMIVMELMEGGTLKDILEDDTFFYSSRWEKAVMKAICEVANALDYIHSQGFVHMDVKPQNIFLDVKPEDPSDLDFVNFKLGDLGSAVKVNGRVKQITPEYAPPDVFEGNARPDFDIFALGMTAYVLLTRKIDRPDLNEMNEAVDCYVKGDMDCVKKAVRKAELMRWNFSIDPAVDNTIKSMISINPSKRPTARDVVRMIRGFNPTIC